ncbi:MAG: 50S ribosomal protein L9 [bacterium]|nr:50S ribosomal protein L9 [bacterium]
MKVILRQDYETLGSAGDVVEVKPGYARNFLIPQRIALEMTKGNLKVLEEEKKRGEQKEVREKKLAEKLAEKLGKVSVTATVTVGEDDRIFGTITSQNVSDLLKEKGFEIDKKQIAIEEQIKALGIYPVSIKLNQGVEASIKLWVVKDTNETT